MSVKPATGGNKKKLRMNESKTVFMEVAKSKQRSKNIINSITVGGDCIVESCSVRNLGVHNELKMVLQVNTIFIECYHQLRVIQHIRPYITKDAAHFASLLLQLSHFMHS